MARYPELKPEDLPDTPSTVWMKSPPQAPMESNLSGKLNQSRGIIGPTLEELQAKREKVRRKADHVDKRLRKVKTAKKWAWRASYWITMALIAAATLYILAFWWQHPEMTEMEVWRHFFGVES